MVTYAEPLDTHDELDWMRFAACQGYEDLFFNEEKDRKGTRRHKEDLAKELCAACPVQAECRASAFDERELYGVWGGLTENERHRLAGRQRTG